LKERPAKKKERPCLFCRDSRSTTRRPRPRMHPISDFSHKGFPWFGASSGCFLNSNLCCAEWRNGYRRPLRQGPRAGMSQLCNKKI